MAQHYRLPLVSLMALGIALPAMAQTPAPAPQPAGPQAQDEQQGRQETVVVTANKREETVQDIAVAVTAVTDELRDEVGLNTVQDLTNFTPGLSFTQANDRIILRGVGRNTNNFGTEPGVANYVDGVYQSTAQIGNRDSIFIDRIEIVRGPQGTLYGRNSIGGALNIITKRPTDSFEAEARITVGNYDTQRIQAAVSGPITDSLRYRLVGAHNVTEEGYLTNRSGLQTEGGRTDYYNFEAQLEGEFGELVDWWAKYGRVTYENYGSPGGRTGVGALANYDVTGIGLPGATLPNPFFGLCTSAADCGAQFALLVPNSTVVLGGQRTNPALTDRRSFNTDFSDVARVPRYEEATLETTFHAPAFDIKYIGGYVSYNYELFQDNDGSAVKQFTMVKPGLPAAGVPNQVFTVFPAAQSDYQENRSWFSNEVNVYSTYDSPLQWIAGLYQYQENFNQPAYSYLTEQAPGFTLRQTYATPPQAGQTVLPPTTFTPAASIVLPGRGLLRSYTNNKGLNHSYGAFVQTDWQFTDQFKLTTGVRYSHDVKNITEEARLVCHTICLFTAPFIPGIGVIPGYNALDITDTTWSGLKRDPQTGAILINTINNVVGATAANPSGATTNLATGIRSRKLSDKWDQLTGTLGLEWTPTNDDLIFGKYSRGYKAGGFGTATVGTNMTPDVRTEKEGVDAYEGGWKREWRDWNLTTNAALFLYTYSDIQTPLTVVPDVGPAFTALVNIPEAETSGFELETNWAPLDNLRIIFNYAYLNAELKEGCCFVDSIDPRAVLPGANPQGQTLANGSRGQSVEGNKLPFSPEHKIAVNAAYTWDFDPGSFTASASYFWRDEFFTSIFNRSTGVAPAFDQTDLRLLWRDIDDRFTIIGYVRNVFDEIGYDAVSNGLRQSCASATVPPAAGTLPVTSSSCNSNGLLTQAGLITTSETLTPPRTYGVELQIRF
jgi:iron complex outermembrane receptor protein